MTVKPEIVQKLKDNPAALFAEAELSARREDWPNMAAALHALSRQGIKVTFTVPARPVVVKV
ncbi:MAG TPA: hypothetical protein VH253_10950 [Phycisphaerae bacterium]|nr:hypothetical protein [Phycisphaerae bacterium]